MKIVFNTSQPNAPASLFYSNALSSINNIIFHDNNYDLYDVALFMTYDHQNIMSVKKKYPQIKIGLIDPRSQDVFNSTNHCDFLIVDSVEMEDYWRQFKKPIFKYVEYPDIPVQKKNYEKYNKITIGYHGNQLHLHSMENNIAPALSNLGKEFNLELLLMYNGQPPRGDESWLPKNVTLKHIQWSYENYSNKLTHSDIGIVPNGKMTKNSLDKILKQKNNLLNLSKDDYVLRFKMPSGPGRIIVFGLLGIPVISDFFPSGIRYLQDGRGLIAHSVAGWEYSFRRLIKSSNLRKFMGEKLQNYIKEKYNFSTQNKKLINFIQNEII